MVQSFFFKPLKVKLLYTLFLLLLFKCSLDTGYAQTSYELNTDWKCAPVSNVKEPGNTLSISNFDINNWIPATVPGTVLTTLLNNKKIPDPFFGMNNEQIPDIYKTGPDYYTYWFIKDFKEAIAKNGNQVYLNFRGVNYSCDIYLNGHKLNKTIQQGMFLRFSYNITSFLAKDGNNRLAVLVRPPNVVYI
jgi:mannosylglycoprotein endo-beta-mannosidase